ncbi:hypothetical protein [Lentzea cavernae]|uniref:Uncharacterized protein n=1 Tax=Lentzea cavernae TaxID=2020703 RepID=A0ABQ3MRL3_9PSEU|nr:hypothetical protein [Lentzea cavernae]GHH57648.1 hypothetical protein GCM10017774_77520 [Lentzea cavernae]
MKPLQTYKMEAWLGDDHGLTDDQVEQLRQISDEIYARYCTPDPDGDDPEMEEADLAQASQEERDVALQTAYRLLLGDEGVIAELTRDRAAARREEARAAAGLRQAALMVIEPGTRHDRSEAAFARRVGVDRMTMRKWLGK